MSRRILQLAIPLVSLSHASASTLEAAWNDEILPIVERYCYDCHGEGIDEGDLDLEDYPDIASMQADRGTWKRIRGHIDQHLMPPIDEDQPSLDQRKQIAEWIDAAIFPVDPENPDPGRVTLRRLNRNEYRNTIYDLLGVEVNAEELLPPDDTGYGFDNIGDVLTLSPVHLERFLETARIALDGSLHPDPMEMPIIVVPGHDLKGPGHQTEEGHFLYAAGKAEAKRTISKAGRYRVTVRAAGTLGNKIPPNMELHLNGEKLHHWPVAAPLDKPDSYSTEITIREPGKCQFDVAFTNDYWNDKLPDPNQRDRNLMVHELLISGPLDGPRPPKPESHRRIYGERPDGASDEQWATEILSRFARRAFRRPPEDGEAERYLHFIRLAKSEGQDVEHGVRLAIEAMLVSPSFLYREEPQPEPDNADQIHLIGEHALASRLSYFLWSSMPDETLMDLADRGQLREQLDPQIDRMIDSKRAQMFITNFSGQWLQLRDVVASQPSSRTFRRTDQRVYGDMRVETEMLFSHLVREDRPITELLDADYSFLNGRLAKHYGIEGIEGDKFRKTPLEGSHRRGILGHGSFLILTSHPTVTSPVLRGKYVLENLLDTAPPPAPPNVPQLSDPRGRKSGLTLRQQLEKHREDPNCASCHALMDPIGFGLENFDADGSWRDEDKDRPIDASGELIGGRIFNGNEELRELILKDHRRDFLRSVSSKMLTYALGRGTDWYDKPAIDAIISQTEQHDLRTRSLIKSIVHSVPFQYRRGDH